MQANLIETVLHSQPAAIPAYILALSLFAALSAFALWRRAKGARWRLIAGLLFALALLSPAIVHETRQPLPAVLLIGIDRSESQQLENRPQQADDAVSALRAAAAAENAEIRTIEFRNQPGSNGTNLFSPVERALAEVPQDQLAGVVIVTDGQIHDRPGRALPNVNVPVHGIITGARGASDARIEIAEAPRYAIVDNPVRLVFRVTAAAGQPASSLPVHLRLPGGKNRIIETAPDGLAQTTLTLQSPGSHIVEATIAAAPDEVTARNNSVLVPLTGIRDRLQVLLVTGRPHAGERVWRRLLKSDAAVDLVHFTILKPPFALTAAPVDELSLIAFPVEELFERRLEDFDLVIFDQYQRRGVLPDAYLQAVADYVRSGGALLIAAGPPFASPIGLYDTSLRDILAAPPAGRVTQTAYRPALSEPGRKHPITAALAQEEQSWGRWHRLIDSEAARGQVLMLGPQNRPLLIVDRVGDGRLAQLMSDQVWLWSRGYDGGGPATVLLRRLAHWLMKEPDLEEESLGARSENGSIVIERQSMGDAAEPVIVTGPDGVDTAYNLEPTGPGKSRIRIEAGKPGVYRIWDPSNEILLPINDNPLEFRDVLPTATVVEPLAAGTGGGIYRAEDGMPEIRWRSGSGNMAGTDWLGLRRSDEYRVTGHQRREFPPRWLWLVIIIAALAAAWWREGRRTQRPES